MDHDPFEPELTPDLILRAYCAGIFPMAESEDSTDLVWVSPEMRGIIPLDGLIVSRSMRKFLRATPFRLVVDRDFDAIIEGCATKGVDRDSTWINAEIRSLYRQLFDRGHCHTVEIYDGSELVGGLYGLAIGAAFFGESMFHTRTNASKMALIGLVDILNKGGFRLLDTQFLTDHLASLGGIEVPRETYEFLLADALNHQAKFGN